MSLIRLISNKPYWANKPYKANKAISPIGLMSLIRLISPIPTKQSRLTRNHVSAGFVIFIA